MYINPIDDPQDTLAAHLPEGYPWDHDAPPPTEPSHPEAIVSRAVMAYVASVAEPIDHDGDEPIHSMRGAPLADRLEEIRLDMADDADREHDEAGSSDRWWV